MSNEKKDFMFSCAHRFFFKLVKVEEKEIKIEIFSSDFEKNEKVCYTLKCNTLLDKIEKVFYFGCRCNITNN